ncbi:uncharacterized protein C2845_PM01G20270 [Panicum miliaceum]|uniref:DUF1618 domain-containing protein n=1 Tax=Panicum miliaceum TaxID=4540 RepID=A0A3L6TJS5_PANMI|nr:uncharacterized protein C2845_PM01G20270 [Panicum miliaceum]
MEDGGIPRGRDVGFVFNLPPRVSFLKVPARIAPLQGTSAVEYPAIVAADPSGCLLLCDRYHSGYAEYLVWLRDDARQDGDSFVPTTRTGDRVAGDYYLCDGITGIATLVPDYPHRGTRDPGSTGLIRRGDEILVVELQCPPDHTRPALCCYSTKTGRWTRKNFACNSIEKEKLSNNGVLAHGGRLWWVDLIVGILTCNPFASKPCLQHVQSPRASQVGELINLGTDLIANVHGIFRSRCVNVSGGHLRYVHIDADNTITTWRLEDPPVDGEWPLDNSAGADLWTLEHKVCSRTLIGGDEAAGLQQIPPVIALLFSVDLHRGRVLDWQPCKVAEASPEYPTSELLIPWQLPPKERSPGVLAGLGSWMFQLLKVSKARLSQCFGSVCDAAATADSEEVPSARERTGSRFHPPWRGLIRCCRRGGTLLYSCERMVIWDPMSHENHLVTRPSASVCDRSFCVLGSKGLTSEQK